MSEPFHRSPKTIPDRPAQEAALRAWCVSEYERLAGHAWNAPRMFAWRARCWDAEGTEARALRIRLHLAAALVDAHEFSLLRSVSDAKIPKLPSKLTKSQRVNHPASPKAPGKAATRPGKKERRRHPPETTRLLAITARPGFKKILEAMLTQDWPQPDGDTLTESRHEPDADFWKAPTRHQLARVGERQNTPPRLLAVVSILLGNFPPLTGKDRTLRGLLRAESAAISRARDRLREPVTRRRKGASGLVTRT